MLIQVEILEDSLKTQVGGVPINLSKGDRVKVDDAIAEYWCSLGWAQDVDGKVETGERVPGASGEIVPDSVFHPAE